MNSGSKPIKRRNPLYRHPLMRKGGRHEKSKTSERQRIKADLKSGRWPDQGWFVEAGLDQAGVQAL